ncbi:MAG TPA: ribosome-associated translation inhibitor RaiA [Bacteroidales bacterium]|jgi:putative sigma-54 modulation protein|nr:ribosome-associated translation inhibitor RaiA [Bacteroidales bacterium]
MQVNINAVHFKTDKKLDQFITDKIEKLSGLYDGIISSEVTLRLEKNEAVENKIAEIKLMVRGSDLFAKKQSKSFEEATDIAVEALRRQLTRHKEKMRGE